MGTGEAHYQAHPPPSPFPPSLPPSLPTCVHSSIGASAKDCDVVISVLGEEEKFLVVVVSRDGGFGHDGGDANLEGVADWREGREGGRVGEWVRGEKAKQDGRKEGTYLCCR